MGGRGSSLIAKHIANNDNIPINAIITLDDPETDIHNNMFKKLKENDISTRKSTDSIDDIILKRQQVQILDISSKYKKILSHTTKGHEIQFGAENMKGRVLGYCGTSIQNGQIIQRIALDNKQLVNYDKVTQTVTQAVKKGWFVPINTMFKSRDYLITHEFGHAVENGIIANMLEKENKNINHFNTYKQEYQEKIKNDVLKLYKKEFTKDSKDDKIYLSEYSTRTAGEWFAETFTNMELADNPAPIAKALKEYLRRINK